MATPIRVNALSTTLVPVKANGPCNIEALTVYNASNAVAYVQCFDAAITNNVTLGTTLPKWVIPVPTVASVSLSIPAGVAFTNGLIVAATATATGNGAPSSALDVALALG